MSTYLVTQPDGAVATVDAYRAVADVGGSLTISTADGNLIFAPRQWVTCLPGDADIAWAATPPTPPPPIPGWTSGTRPFA